jgi:hypothetical protein
LGVPLAPRGGVKKRKPHLRQPASRLPANATRSRLKLDPQPTFEPWISANISFAIHSCQGRSRRGHGVGRDHLVTVASRRIDRRSRGDVTGSFPPPGRSAHSRDPYRIDQICTSQLSVSLRGAKSSQVSKHWALDYPVKDRHGATRSNVLRDPTAWTFPGFHSARL